MAIGAGIAAAGIGAGLISGSKAAKAAKQAAAASAAESGRQYDLSMAQMKEAVEYLKAQGVPEEEAQRIALETAQLDPSAMEDISLDPRLRSAQMDALAGLQERGEAGLTEEEKSQQDMIMRSAGAQAQAQDKAVLQNMAERGIGGSGSELIARLQGSQSAADRASVGQAQLAGQAQNRALEALGQAGQLGGQIRGQEYGEQANLASARDRINQFNEQQRVATANQQEIHNKALIQQQYENELAKRQGVASAQTMTAQAGVDRAGQISKAGQARAEGELASGAAKSKLYGDLASAGASAYGAYAKKDSGEDGGIMGYADGGIPNSNGGFAGGGMPVPESGMGEEERYLEGDVVPGEEFAGDRVDAKVNSGEMVLNIEQQQRLMDLLKGLRGVQDLGDEDIVSPVGEVSSPDVMMDDPMKGLPQGGIPAEELPVAPESMPALEDGGMVPSDYKTNTEAKPRGVHASMKHEKEAEEKSTNDSKARKARIKAYETIINGGR